VPRLPLVIGQIDQESDQSSTNDTVLAHLYNGYRVGQAIHQWPDLAQHCDLGTGAKVWTWYSATHGKHYAVSGRKLFRIDNGIPTEITGAAFPFDAPATFTEDRHRVFVAANSPIYQIIGNTAVYVGGQAPLNVTSLAFLSGFLVANGDDPAGGGLPGDFAYSDTQGEDGIPTYLEWSYENNASKPDALMGLVATTDDYLYCIGADSVDVNYISGNVDNPFAPNKAASQNVGCVAKHSIAYDSANIYFLSTIQGNRQIVRLVNGREPQIIGFPIGVPIQEIADVSTARGFTVGFRSQAFYVITFPAANVYIDGYFQRDLTLAFAVRAQEWYIVGEWNTDTAGYGAYRAVSFAYDSKTGFVGGDDGKIYTFTPESRPSDLTLYHRWRNDGELEWRTPRELALGTIGQRRVPMKSRCCGRYTKRQDEFVFANGGMRMAVRTGWRDWGSMVEKISQEYSYDVKRGDEELVLNGIEENFEAVR
jgi:hypothetical protein